MTQGNCCEKCKFWHKAAALDTDGECRMGPPTPFVFPGKTPLGAQVMITQCFFPKCRPEIYCGQFQPKLELAS